MKEKHKQAFMRTAEVFAECSTAVRAKVGAIIVKDDRIISIGYNGMPSGWDNTCENFVGFDNGGEERLNTKPEVLHAEMNALMKLAKSTESGDGSSIFITHSPCLECAKGIYQAGIKEVYYSINYRNTDGIDFLEKCNIKIEKLDV
jgi:dCMP deaminase